MRSQTSAGRSWHSSRPECSVAVTSTGRYLLPAQPRPGTRDRNVTSANSVSPDTATAEPSTVSWSMQGCRVREPRPKPIGRSGARGLASSPVPATGRGTGTRKRAARQSRLRQRSGCSRRSALLLEAPPKKLPARLRHGIGAFNIQRQPRHRLAVPNRRRQLYAPAGARRPYAPRSRKSVPKLRAGGRSRHEGLPPCKSLPPTGRTAW